MKKPAGNFSKSPGATNTAGSNVFDSAKQEELNQFIEYLKSVCNRVDSNDFGDSEEKKLFISQVMTEVLQKGSDLALNQRSSKLLEKLMTSLLSMDQGNWKTIYKAVCRMLKTLSKNCEEIVSNLYGSHVVQKMVDMIPLLMIMKEKGGNEDCDGENNKEEDDEMDTESETPDSMEDSLSLFVTQLLKPGEGSNRSADMMCHPQATHVFRSLFRALCLNIPTSTSLKLPENGPPSFEINGSYKKKNELIDVKKVGMSNKIFLKLLDGVCNEIKDYIQTDNRGIVMDSYGSPALQEVLKNLFVMGGRNKKIDKLISVSIPFSSVSSSEEKEKEAGADTEATNSQLFSDVIRSPVGSRVLEVCLHVMNPDAFLHTFTHYFLPQIQTLSLDRSANFVVQRLLQTPNLTSYQLSQVVQKLDFKELLEKRKEGVIWKVLEGSRRLQVAQKEIAKNIFSAFDCKQSDTFQNLWFCILSLNKHSELVNKYETEKVQGEEEEGEEKKEETKKKNISEMYLQPSGCSLLEALLRFKAEDVQPLVTGVKRFTRHKKLVVKMAKNPQASRVLEAALDTASPLPPALIQKIVKALRGNLLQTALNPHGSFVVTAAHRAADVELKKKMAEELLGEGGVLRERNYSVWRLCRLGAFMENEDSWKQQQTKAQKTQDLFKDILGNEGGKQKKTDKKETEEEGEEKEESSDEEEEEEDVEDIMNLMGVPSGGSSSSSLKRKKEEEEDEEEEENSKKKKKKQMEEEDKHVKDTQMDIVMSYIQGSKEKTSKKSMQKLRKKHKEMMKSKEESDESSDEEIKEKAKNAAKKKKNFTR